MSDKKKKKLALKLKKESLRRLSESELNAAQGGGDTCYCKPPIRREICG